MPDPHRQIGARTTITICHVAAFASLWPLSVCIVGDPLAWYLMGGPAMHLLVLIALGQGLLGVWLGFRQLRAPLPVSVHLAAPVTAVLAGLGASTAGVHHAFDALPATPPDLNLQTLTATLANAELPQQFGVLVGGLGCTAVAITASLVAFLNRGSESRRPALIIAALGLLSGVTAATVFRFAAPHDTDPALLAWLAALALVGSACLASAAPGVMSLVGRDGLAPAVGFSLAVLTAISTVGAVVLVGVAMVAQGRIEALQATGMAPLDMAPILITGGATAIQLGSQMMLAFGLAVALPAAALLWYARAGLRAWLRQRLRWAVLTIAMVAAAAAVYGRFRSELEIQVSAAAVELRPRTPEGIELAGSSSTSRYVSGAGQVVVLRGDTVSLHDRVVGSVDESDTFERLAEALRPSAQLDAGHPDDLVAHLVTASALVPPDCPEPILEPFALVADGTTPAEEVTAFAAAMRARGACRMRLLVRPRALLDSPDLLAQRDAMWRELRDTGMLAALYQAASNDWYAIFGYLTTSVPEANDEMTPIVLGVQNEAVRISAPEAPDSIIAPTRRGRVDRDALALDLEDLKTTYPEERRVFITDVGDASLQDLVDVLDAAREEVEFEDDTIATLDKVVFVTESDPETSAAEKEEEEKEPSPLPLSPEGPRE